jgi:hypothetical protein
MGGWILLLAIAVVLLLRKVSALRQRLETLESQLDKSAAKFETLHERLRRLERAASHAPDIEPTAPRAADAALETTDALPPVFAPSPQPAAPVPPPVLTEVVAADATRPPESTTAPVPAPVPVPVPEPATAESWEMVVGTSWLNKIGVLVSIIGVALIVSYSFTHIGPAGRVGLGYLLSAAMLGAGVLLERREPFRNYAYGLVAGGWAGVYFTTFAMHDVAAAKIIDSDLLGISLLSAVAAAMIVHSLRYRSQVVTGLAYIAAYATLALSPLSGFALISSVPLAVSVLAVSQRLGWTGISTMGIASTYGVFILRQTVVPDGAFHSYDTLPYATLAAYWTAFEAADIIGLRIRASRAVPNVGRPAPMMWLNAVGLFAAALLTLPPDNPVFVSNFLAVAASAYLTSAILRARWLPPDPGAADETTLFTSRHGATAIAAGLYAWAIDLRFIQNRETLGLLLETELLVAAGLTLRDVWVRRFGAAIALLATGHAWSMGVERHVVASTWPLSPSSAALCLVAMAWYANREAVHRRARVVDWIDQGYSWAGTLLFGTAVVVELAPAHQALAGLMLAVLLIEVALRRGPDFGAQSYLLSLASLFGIVLAFIAPAVNGQLQGWGAAPGTIDNWIVLPAAIALAFEYAWRVASRRHALGEGAAMVASAAAALGTALLAIFEWRVLSPAAVAPMWAASALALIAIGGARRITAMRWQGYALTLVAGYRALLPLTYAAPADGASTVSVALVIAAMYAAGYLGRRAAESPAGTPADTASPEFAMAATLGVLATSALALFKWRVLPDDYVGPAWAVTAVVLVGLGYLRGRQGQRVQGYAVAVLAAVHVGVPLLDRPSPPMDETLWAGAVAALLYGVAHLAHRAAVTSSTTGPAMEADRPAGRLVLSLATLLLAIVESRLWIGPIVAPIWTVTAAALIGAGLVRRVTDLRWQGYVLLFAGAARSAMPLLRAEAAAPGEVLWLSVVIALLYGISLAARRGRNDDGSQASALEDWVRQTVLLCATVMLAGLILRKVPESLVTPALGLQGILLLFVGIPAHERVLRLSGLVVLLVCILKLFVFDLRQLEPLARIFSFVVLGLFLLAVSWIYTRYKEQIRRFL